MLNPANWSATTWRIFGASVLVLDICFIVTIVLLGGGGVKAHRPIIAPFAALACFLTFLFLWLAVGVEKGYGRGFLLALGFVAIVLVVFRGWGWVIKNLLP